MDSINGRGLVDSIKGRGLAAGEGPGRRGWGLESSIEESLCLFGPQFAVLMWILTYVGAFFNGLTLLILGKIQPHPTAFWLVMYMLLHSG